MSDKKMNRREFLKVVIASAAAAGLSHFRFLNFGGAQTVLADNVGCDIGIPDFCDPGEPGNYDTCPDPVSTSGSDVCIPPNEPDLCDLGIDPDICDPVNPPPDICDPAAGAPDQCEVPPGGPDTCMKAADDPDICPDGGAASGGDGDICTLTGQPNPDECIPSVGESDKCSPETGPDFCRVGGVVVHDTCGGELDPDICYENEQNVVDICDPDAGDPDTTNALQLTAFQARSDITTLGAVAALGAATLLLPRKEK